MRIRRGSEEVRWVLDDVVCGCERLGWGAFLNVLLFIAYIPSLSEAGAGSSYFLFPALAIHSA